MDGRGKWARRFSDLIYLYSQDVTDDPGNLPETVKSVIRRAATMTVELEMAETQFAKKGRADAPSLAAYQTTTNSLHRLLQALQVKASLSSRIDRPLDEATGVFVRHRSFTAEEWAVGAVTDAEKRHLARWVSFSINEAKHKGFPLHPSLARLGVTAGLCEYVEDKTIEYENE